MRGIRSMGGLDQIIRENKGFHIFYDRFKASMPATEEAKAAEQKIQSLMPRIYAGIAPEQFGLLVAILDAGLDVYEKLEIVEERKKEKPKERFTEKTIPFLEKTLANLAQFVDPDFQIMLKAGAGFVQRYAATPYPETEAFECAVPSMIFDNAKLLEFLRQHLPADGFDSFMNIVNNADYDPCSWCHSVNNLVEAVAAAETKGYETQLKAMLELMANVRGDVSGGIELIHHFPETCDALAKKKKLHYYDKMAGRLASVAASRSHNLVVLSMAPRIIGEYEKAGLTDRFLGILDIAVQHTRPGNQKRRFYSFIPSLDNSFKFFVNFPHYYKKYGEDSIALFRKVHARIGDCLPLRVFMPAVDKFFEKELEQKIAFDSWLIYAGRAAHALSQGIRPGILASYVSERFLQLSKQHLAKGLIEAVYHNTDLDSYAALTPQLQTAGLLSDIKSIKPILNSSAPNDVKSRFVDYLYVLYGIPRLPAVRCDESWLRRVARHIGMEYGIFKEWIDGIIDQRNLLYRNLAGIEMDGSTASLRKEQEIYAGLDHLVEYVPSIPNMVEHGLDLVKAMGLWGHVLPDHVVNLKEIINADRPLADKISFLEQIKDHKKGLAVLPPTDFNAEAWIREYQEASRNYFPAVHDIQLEYPADFVVKLLNVALDPRTRADLIALARLEERGETTKRLFTPGKVYASEQVFGLTQQLDPTEAARLLVQGLISRNHDIIFEVMEYFDPQKLSKARSFVEHSNTPPTRLYRLIATDFRNLGSNDSKSLEAGARVISAIRERYLSSSVETEGKTELRELVWLVESLYKGGEIL